MAKRLLSVIVNAIAFTSLSAQYQILPEDSNLVRMAIEQGVDSVDYPGFVHLHKYGVPMHVSNSAFRMGPDENSAPLFLPNPGFETGDFSGWNGIIGENTTSSLGALQEPQPGIFNGAINPVVSDQTARHSIMTSAAGYDPEGSFPVVPAGYGVYTARLGNTYATYQGQSITRSWLVTAADTTVTFSFAVVLENGSHGVAEGAYFEYEISDSTGAVLIRRHDETYALPFGYQSGASGGTVKYLSWTTHTYNLTQYAGTWLTFTYTAAGCVLGGHYGYAYVDADPWGINSVGLHEHEHSAVSVYPNPSNTGVYFLNCDMTWNSNPPIVFDITGRVVDAFCTATETGWQIDISETANGTYFAIVQTEEGVKHCNLIH